MSSVVGHLYYQSVHDQVTRTRRLSEGDTTEDDTDESLEALVSRLSLLSQAPVFRTRPTLVTQDIEDLIQAFSRSIRPPTPEPRCRLTMPSRSRLPRSTQRTSSQPLTTQALRRLRQPLSTQASIGSRQPRPTQASSRSRRPLSTETSNRSRQPFSSQAPSRTAESLLTEASSRSRHPQASRTRQSLSAQASSRIRQPLSTQAPSRPAQPLSSRSRQPPSTQETSRLQSLSTQASS